MPTCEHPLVSFVGDVVRCSGRSLSPEVRPHTYTANTAGTAVELCGWVAAKIRVLSPELMCDTDRRTDSGVRGGKAE